jgi:hypothetical protein
MGRSVFLSLVLVFTPAAAVAQTGPQPTTAASTRTVQQQAALRQLRVQFEQSRLQTRARFLAALTPAHRTAVANIVGQLELTVNPNLRAGAQALDAVLTPGEKQSILNIAAAEKANTQVLRQQQKLVFAATLTPAERAQATQREAQRQAYRQKPSASDACP